MVATRQASIMIIGIRVFQLRVEYFRHQIKDFNSEDGVDWSITGDNIANLQTKIVPQYWENLQNVVYAVVRIIPCLYVWRDWNRFGYLMVFKLFVFN